MKKLELDHFENTEELLESAISWVADDFGEDYFENRWFSTRGLVNLTLYTIDLEQENQALKDQIETMQINWKPAPTKNSETIVKTCKCDKPIKASNLVYDKTPLLEQIADQEIYIKNTLKSLNEWKEYAERVEELIDKIKATTPLELAIMFHDTYEELAPKFNYETRKDTKEFDENSNNGKLMIAVCSKLLDLIKVYEDE